MSAVGPTLSLEWVLGCDSTPNTVHAVAHDVVCFVSGNVGILYWTRLRRQVLLRGHQNPIKACVVSPDKRLIITACTGAVNSSIIVWSAASGDALCTLDGAHLQGSLALAVSSDSRLLASLSTPFPVPLRHPDAIAGGAAGSSPVMAAQEVSVWQLPSALCSVDGEHAAVLPPAGLQLLACVLIPVTDPQHSIAFNGVGALGRSHAASSGTSRFGDVPLLLLHELVTTGVGSAVFWSLFAGALEEEADEAKTSDPSLLLQPNSWQWQAIHSVAPVPGCASPVQHPEWALAAAGEASASCRRRLLGLAGTEVQLPGSSAGASDSAGGGRGSQRQPPAGILVSSSGLGSSGSRLGATTAAGQPGFPQGDTGLRPATASGGSSGAAVALYSQLARQGMPSLGLGAGGIFRGVTWAGDRRRCTATAFLPFRTVSGSSTCVSALTVTTDGLAVMWASGLDSADEEEVARAAGGGMPAAAEAEAAAAAVGAGTVASHFPVVLLMPRDAEAACATAAHAEGGERAGSRGGRGPSAAAQSQPLPLPDRLAAVRRLAGQLCMRGAAKTVRLAKSLEGADAGEGLGEGDGDGLLSASGPSLGGAGTGSVLPPASSLNALLLAPGGGHILVGGEDGCLRCYDTQLRLVAWWEELEAGGIVCMDFFPQGPLASAGAHPLGGAGGAVEDSPVPPPAGAAALPPLLMETRRSLLLRLDPASFEGGSPDDRKGSVLLEGPDAAVAGVAAYPAPFAHLLAVAVASGCVQLWDTGGGAASTSSHPQLLAVRELIRPHGFAAGSAAAAAAALAAPQLYHPTCLALDPLCRFLGVGTAEGFVCLLDPLTLSDTQPALQPGSFHSAAASATEAGGGFVSGTGSSSASLAAAVGAGPSLLGRSAAPLTHVTFAADGLHLAASDSERHVLLWRFVRKRTRQISGRATSRLGLGRSGSVLGNRRRHGGPTSPGAGVFAHRPRAWELVAGDAAGMEEGVEDRWTYLGRAKTHGAAVTGLSFSHLPPGTPASPHAAPLISTPASAPGSTGLTLAAARGGGCEGGEGAFWDSAGELVHGGASRPGSEQAGDPSQIAPRSVQGGALGQHAAAGLSMLASVGADRRVVLYDVGASGVTSGLTVAAHGGARHAIAQFATPTSCLWYPPTSPPLDSEPDAAAAAECLLVASSDVKLRAWRFTPHPAAAAAAASHGLSAAASLFPGVVAPSTASLALTQQAPACTKTVLAPSTLGSITHMLPVASGPATDTGLLAFATDDRVVGIAALPLSGSPLSAVAVLAHPGPVTGLAVSHSGFRLFSCGREAPAAAGDSIAQRGRGAAALQDAGGGSGSVCIWSLQPAALLSQLGGAATSGSARSSLSGEGEAATAPGPVASGDGMAPFLELLEAGASSSAAQAHVSPGPAPGLFYQQVCDVFAYAQIRSQGEDSTARRAVGISLPLGEVPAVMRALGFYPTSHDMAAMHCEAVGAAYTTAYRRALGVGRAAAIFGGQLPPGAAASATAAGVAAALRAEVDLPSLVRLLANHRPFVSVGREQLLRALRIIGNHVESTEGGAGAGGRGGGFFAQSVPTAPSAIRALRAEAGDRSDDGFAIRWGALTRLLAVRGERILGSELATCLTALLGPPEREGGSGDEGEGGDSHFDDEDELTPAALVGRVLGFAE